MDANKVSKVNRTTQRYKLIMWGLLVHFLLLFAVFDIYFASPLDRGMPPVKSMSSPPAKRLVLIVADGLRAEAVIGDNKTYRIPFLSKIIESGTWGVVHTRVPTESRPGHVAVMAGIYEDPSAIFKGWKANPVSFDSVISQSTNAWCWGSPGIVDLFNKDNLRTIKNFTYSLKLEDFGKRRTGVLDTWVYNEVEKFLRNVRDCRDSNCNRYFSKGNLFFMHLLGTDTAGHGYKPHSKEYIDNIKLVDDIAKNFTVLFGDTFKDNSTAFVFTSDHGMTDWGSHGAGSLHETEVPIFAWGAGVKVNKQRQDINQIDIAPLLASLIGINLPINSLGILPVNFLNVSEPEVADLMMSNAFQLINMFNKKRLRTKINALIYRPFKGITTGLIKRKLNNFRELKQAGQIEIFVRECTKFMKLLVQGVDYYHNYYQYPLLVSISIGFIGWILLLSLSVFLCDKKRTSTYTASSTNIAAEYSAIIILMVILICYKQAFPFTYYLHFLFPVVMYSLIFQYMRNYDILVCLQFTNFKNNFFNALFCIIGIELMVYGFFNRLSFSVLMILVGFGIYLSEKLRVNTNSKEKINWMICCSVVSIFPYLPVMKTSFSVPLYVFGFLGWIFLFQFYVNKIKVCETERTSVQFRALLVQFFCVTFSAIYVLVLQYGLISNDSNIKYLSWLLTIIPILMVPLTCRFVASRLIAIVFAFAPFYLLVSTNYEVLFSVFYVALLWLWLLIESKSFQFGTRSDIIYYTKFERYKFKNRISCDIFRRSFLFMVFIFVGFFGTGNIASLNSFDPMWVRAFLTKYSPFKMTGLILLKFSVPFIFTSCFFRAINLVGKENILIMFHIILIFSDLMVLQFLYLITNVGSWLDIGSSLSHFVIMDAFVIILLVLYGIAHLLTTISY